ncbi:MAG: 4-(cytidine 5'-diphospho)-2-C-methyl-D-erythritol kinase [Clostridiales bacterium]|nr:4-(cytidine 5'-diphospho)-2-C-methyl-D-erythritol kinase [Clostridiales bacterium]
MKEIELTAYAKINFAIDLLGKRVDGYNDVKMIMQTIDLSDKVYIEKIDTGIEVVSDIKIVSSSDKNIAYKAAEHMIKRYNIKSGVKIEIKKGIPISAGLGGGSADAAAVIIGMNKLFDLGLNDKELRALGKELGADVPFCIMRNTALAQGIGERLIPLPDIVDMDLIIIKPCFGVSTKEVYESFDYNEPKRRPDFEILIDAISKRDILGIAKNMANVLESVTEKNFPVIADIKDRLIKNRALGAMMSGSGPSVFGIFESSSVAQAAYKAMANKGDYHCYLAKTVCFR